MKFSKHYFFEVIFLCKGKYNTIQCNRHYFAMIHSQQIIQEECGKISYL